MTITTLDQVIADVQPVQHFFKNIVTTNSGRVVSLWSQTGRPGPGSYNAGVNGGTYVNGSPSLVAGAIERFDPGLGNAYLNRVTCTNAPFSTGGMLLVCDRIWDNGGLTITSTSTQTFASGALPARDQTGSANGVGYMLGVEVSGAAGAGTPTLTVGYTNSSGTAGRTATNIDATYASPPQGAFFRVRWQTGDVGVQSVQSITLSATWTSGTISVVVYRVLAAIQNAVLYPSALDCITGGFPRIWNGTCPFLLHIASTAAGYAISGTYQEAQG